MVRILCSRIPCYYFRLLPRPIPSGGIGTVYTSLRYRIEVVES